jgi:hypothetical protein
MPKTYKEQVKAQLEAAKYLLKALEECEKETPNKTMHSSIEGQRTVVKNLDYLLKSLK